jgi:CRP-like cAMP-binding protein
MNSSCHLIDLCLMICLPSQTYFQKEWANRGDLYKEDTMQLQLPDALRSRCLLSILEPLMMSVPILSSISSSSRQLIAAKMIHVDIGSDYEFCQEGDEPDGLWLLESGQAYVLDLRGKICFTLEAPALFGDAVFISDQVLACRDRVWGYRASQDSKIWRLKLQDLTAILRVCPTVKTATYAYIQSKLLQLLCDIPGDYMYNEVVARVMLILEHAPPSLRDKAIDQIRMVGVLVDGGS